MLSPAAYGNDAEAYVFASDQVLVLRTQNCVRRPNIRTILA